jgi:hypothetical protein
MDNNNFQDNDMPPEMDEDQAREICQALELENCNKEILEATILNLTNGDANLQYRIINSIVAENGMDPDGIADSLKEHLPGTFNGNTDTEYVIDRFKDAIRNNMNNLPQQGGRRKRQTKKHKSKRRGHTKRRKTHGRRTRRRSRR